MRRTIVSALAALLFTGSAALAQSDGVDYPYVFGLMEAQINGTLAGIPDPPATPEDAAAAKALRSALRTTQKALARPSLTGFASAAIKARKGLARGLSEMAMNGFDGILGEGCSIAFSNEVGSTRTLLSMLESMSDWEDLSGQVDAIEADFLGYSFVGTEEFLAEHATWVRSLNAVQKAARKLLAKQAGRGVHVTFSTKSRLPTEDEVFSAPRAKGTITVHPDTGAILLLSFTATRTVKGVEETFTVNLPYGGGIGVSMIGGGLKTGVFMLDPGDHGDFDRTGDGLEPLHRDMSGGALTLYSIDAVKGTASGYVWFNSGPGITTECHFGLKGLDVVEGIPFIPGPI